LLRFIDGELPIRSELSLPSLGPPSEPDRNRAEDWLRRIDAELPIRSEFSPSPSPDFMTFEPERQRPINK
jgi:hypothetical protein